MGIFESSMKAANQAAQIALQTENAIRRQQNIDENFELQKEQYQYKKDLNQEIMDRQDSAMQRNVADVEKAGFSKQILAGGGGSESGSISTSPAPQKDDPVSFGGIIGNAIGLKNQMNTLLQQEKTIHQTQAQTIKTIADTDLTNKQKEALTEQIKKVQSETKSIDAKTKQTEHDNTLSVRQDRRSNDGISKIYSTFKSIFGDGKSKTAPHGQKVNRKHTSPDIFGFNNNSSRYNR